MWNYAWIVGLPPLLLLATGLLPEAWADRNVRSVLRVASILMGFTSGCTLVTALLLYRLGPVDVVLVGQPSGIPVSFSVFFDSLAAVMTILISLIGLVITRYSIRYLDGEATQGRFLRWTLFTLGAVLLMVVSGNLVLFTTGWILSSYGLHRLLTHYPDRPWAIWAARKKFLISRLGDAMLLPALALTYATFGSFEYRDVFVAAQVIGLEDGETSWQLSLIGALFVFGAMTKSAQFPFHSWLPDTMETPTPVSALMHAGVINAGGFLVIRLSPIVAQSHLALDTLAISGALTALFGGIVMLTQTSVKRALAYSTIAQMGFMMLQCGLGAFSAALLHILAHSLYKAHAFLSSGSVLDAAARLRVSSNMPSTRYRLVTLPLAGILAVGLSMVNVWVWGMDLSSKPGFVVLELILILALTHLLWQALAARTWSVTWKAIASAGALHWLYVAAWRFTDNILSSSVSQQPVTPSTLDNLLLALVAIGFLGVFVLQAVTPRLSSSPLLSSLYVHAANGFYCDIPARRLTARVWGIGTPAP